MPTQKGSSAAQRPNNGGARPGAGRKAGVPNKVTGKAREKALAGGASMLDIVVEEARALQRDLLEYRALKKPKHVTLLEKSRATLEAAAKAMPYLHPKATPIATGAEADIKVTVTGGLPDIEPAPPADKSST